ncbi:Helix-turn-helix [Stigmatella aurantiaca]|uniref:Helix-turn-helix n=1 Tax=Stigmatella aurantiaca TaxID=41 RepID=A0A1H7PMF0_STIAU|nr:helix-turn-helix domain-containing protein [Stigmatella aurantiaca]SEL36594.1 Helix-turn-helix [Stigmatella aurantiaca]
MDTSDEERERKRVEALRKNLGANTRRARERLGITQEQMAEMLGISPEVYGRMERGLIFPRVERLAVICEKLGESSDRLLGLANSQEPLPATGTPGYDELLPILHRLMPVMPKLTQLQRVAVRRHIADFQRLLSTFLETEPSEKRRKRRASDAPAG